MDAKLQNLLFKVYEHHLKRLFKILEQESIEAVLLKGWSAVRFYDDPLSRKPGDFDLMVSPEKGGIVQDLLSDEPDLSVDLHLGPRQLDSLSFEKLYSRSETVDLEGVDVRVLCPEDHLRVICVHWLTDGGERKDRLWDIYWAVKNRPDTFDWDKCLGVVSERRRRWVVCTIGLAHRHLDLHIDDLPFADEARDLPRWFSHAIESRWAKGIPHIPLQNALDGPKPFWDQLKKRFPPSPVMATVAMEGDFEARTRVHYQIGYIFRQAKPSLLRVIPAIRQRLKRAL